MSSIRVLDDQAARTVLLLDDRAEDRDLMSTLLRHAGHRVIEASSGEEALAVARERRPALIIADILMPGMNGYEFVSRLRQDPELAATPVIFSSANYLEDEVRKLSAACGVSAFISKPCPPDVVWATVAEALDGSLSVPMPGPTGPGFEREHSRVMNNKLVEKVTELERVSAHRWHLLGLVMEAQEEERQRIAVGVHDDSLQAVCAVGLGLGNLRRRIDDAETLDVMAELQNTVQVCAQRLRSLLFDLQPPELEYQGLVPALRAYLEHAESEEGLLFTLDDRLPADPDPELRAFLYSVGREILMNVRKHAHASSVEVTLTVRDGRHILSVHDDGVGFNVSEALRPRPGHLGLAALTERVEIAGGVLRIETTPGAGATVELEIPDPGTPISSGRGERYPAEIRA
jgi:signal transduction histidine kinase